VNSAFPALSLAESDVTLVHRGVVPGVRNRHGVLGLMGHHRIRDHRADGLDGAISVTGVKYTTGRGVAEQVVDLVSRTLGRLAARCRTGTTRLPGCDADSTASELIRARAECGALLPEEGLAALVATHGTHWRPVVALCRADMSLAEPIAPGCPFPKAAVVHAIRAEMACTLADVLVRRLPTGAAGYPGDAAAAACAAVMASACGWDAARTSREIEALREFYRIV